MKTILFYFSREREHGRHRLMQDLLGRRSGLRHVRVRPHGNVHQLRQAACRVPHLQAVHRPSGQDLQSLNKTKMGLIPIIKPFDFECIISSSRCFETLMLLNFRKLF